MHGPLKNRTCLGKKLFFNFLGADFFVPKGGHQREKQRALDPGCYLMIVFLCSVIKIKFYGLIAASLFFWKIKN